MSLLDSLASLFDRDRGPDPVPDGLCPNCWGQQEYGDQIRDMARDRQVDVNNHRSRHAFVQDFVVQHVDGIRVRGIGKGGACPTCHTAGRAKG